LLRIEDIDATRCRPEFETAIYEDLAWLGIAWENAGAAAVRNIFLNTATRSKDSLPRVWSIRVSKAAAKSQHWWRSGRSRRPGRAIRTVRRSIPVLRKSLPADQRARLLESGARYALRLDMAAARARVPAI